MNNPAAIMLAASLAIASTTASTTASRAAPIAAPPAPATSPTEIVTTVPASPAYKGWVHTTFDTPPKPGSTAVTSTNTLTGASFSVEKIAAGYAHLLSKS